MIISDYIIFTLEFYSDILYTESLKFKKTYLSQNNLIY